MQENTTSLPAGRAIAMPAPKNAMGYTVAEAAKILGKHPNTIYAWTRPGYPLADARQIGSTFYIPRWLRPAGAEGALGQTPLTEIEDRKAARDLLGELGAIRGHWAEMEAQ